MLRSNSEISLFHTSNNSNPGMSLRSWPRSAKYQFIFISLAFLVLIYFCVVILYGNYNSGQNCSNLVGRFEGSIDLSQSNSDLTELPPIKFPELSPADYHKLCFPLLDQDTHISNTYKKVQSLLSGSENEACQNVGEVFKRIYKFSKSTGDLKLPQKFVAQVKAWLSNNEELFDAVDSQDVYTVVNQVDGESSIFNTLRSKRPVSKPPQDPLEYIEQTAASTKDSCDFCKFREHTAEDVFGRVISTHSASASNTFKMAKFHALFFPFGHHPLNISFETLADLFLNTAQQWLKKVTESDPSQIYPVLLWDTLPHAGASQVHPHIHALTDPSQYIGTWGVLNTASRHYFSKYGSHLVSDMILVHWALGLVLVEGNAVAVVPITARKDNEYMIISSTLNMDAVKLLYRVLQAYRSKLGVYCFSAGASLPVVGSANLGLPFIFRLGSRGDCSAVRSDVSSLELYVVNNINSDLGKTVKALKDVGEL